MTPTFKELATYPGEKKKKNLCLYGKFTALSWEVPIVGWDTVSSMETTELRSVEIVMLRKL